LPSCFFKLPTNDAGQIKSILFKQYQIEVPVMRHGSDVYLRYTIQAFNTQEDLDKLYDALVAIRCQF
jgi:isopenicillin-N epimerase